MRISDWSSDVCSSDLGTAVVFGAMASVATTSKRDFSTMHKFLFIGVVILIVASLANIFLQLPALMLTISVMAIAIFSALLLVDLQRVLTGGETNYVDRTSGGSGKGE